MLGQTSLNDDDSGKVGEKSLSRLAICNLQRLDANKLSTKQ
jgi:hypothetical protein